MGRSVFANTNRIVGKNVNVRKLGKRGQTNRCPTVIGEDQKRRTRRPEDSMIRNSIHDRAHAVFPNTEMDVATGWSVTGEIPAILDVIQRRAVEIGAAADEKRHRFRNRLKRFASRLACRELRVLRKLRDLREKIGVYFSIDRGVEQLRLLGVFLSPVVV